MAFWKIKFDKKKINYIKFIAGFMIVATACRVDERKFVEFFFRM